MLVSIAMLSNIAEAWPVSITQPIGALDVSIKFNDSNNSAAPVQVIYSLSVNTGSFTETNTGSSSGVICATGDSEDMKDGESREGFTIELKCSPSKFI